MAPICSALSPSTSLFFSQPLQKTSRPLHTHQNIFKIYVAVAAGTGGSKYSMAKSAMSASETMNFGFKNLKETFWVDVQRAEGSPLNVPMSREYSWKLEMVENVAIRIELKNGCVGWGEVPLLPSVADSRDQLRALAKVNEMCKFLRQSPPMTLSLVLDEIGGILPGHAFASVRAGLEMALIDAMANSIDVPLWRLFGGVSNTITTAVTVEFPGYIDTISEEGIPVDSAVEASEWASNYSKLGFDTFKLEVGKNINADIEVLRAIQAVHPDCSFILDANEGYTSKESIRVLEKLQEMGMSPVLFEQPVHRDDWKGLGEVSNIARDNYGISIAADESCRSLSDVQKIIKENLANVINVKLAKFGVLGSLEIVEMARKSCSDLMISDMVQTRLATGFAGHLAAGLGCFKFVGLDTPLLLSEDPVIGGYEVSGAVYKFTNARGQGGFLKWDMEFDFQSFS